VTAAVPILTLLAPLIEQLISRIPDPQQREKVRAEAEAG
jgi:hypothetical protein